MDRSWIALLDEILSIFSEMREGGKRWMTTCQQIGDYKRISGIQGMLLRMRTYQRLLCRLYLRVVAWLLSVPLSCCAETHLSHWNGFTPNRYARSCCHQGRLMRRNSFWTSLALDLWVTSPISMVSAENTRRAVHGIRVCWLSMRVPRTAPLPLRHRRESNTRSRSRRAGLVMTAIRSRILFR
jgi:hypothetical protein